MVKGGRIDDLASRRLGDVDLADAWSEGRSGLTEAYPVDTSADLRRLIDRFQRSKRTQEVSFRSLVDWIRVGERATHYIHSYPAKLLPQIAHFFLSASKLCPRDGVVLDPFGGTGTVALETVLSNRTAYYADANPLARLIARVKTTNIEEVAVRSSLPELESRYKRSRAVKVPNVVNVDHWYDTETIRKLARLRAAIDGEGDPNIRDFLLVTFSSVSRKVSHADPRLSVPVRLKEGCGRNIPADFERRSDVFGLFSKQLNANLKRLANLKGIMRAEARSYCVGEDARSLRDANSKKESLQDGSVDLVITSPPYAGAQKYIRASSLSLGWLGMTDDVTLKSLENLSIGREHLPKHECVNLTKTGVSSADRVIKKIYGVNPVRAAIASTYLLEMRSVVVEICRVLKPGGHVVLVIGNNEICGNDFMSSKYLEEMFVSQGMRLKLRLIDEIKSRGLMTKRNGSSSLIAREWILLLEKP